MHCGYLSLRHNWNTDCWNLSLMITGTSTTKTQRDKTGQREDRSKTETEQVTQETRDARQTRDKRRDRQEMRDKGMLTRRLRQRVSRCVACVRVVPCAASTTEARSLLPEPSVPDQSHFSRPQTTNTLRIPREEYQTIKIL